MISIRDDATLRGGRREERRCGGRDSFGCRWRRCRGGVGSGRGRGGSSSRRGRARRIGRARGTTAVARARHLAGEGGAPLAQVGARVPVPAAVARGVAQGRVPRRPLLGAERSRPPRRRGRRGGRPGPRAAGARRPLRQGRQPRRPTARERLEQPLSLARAPYAHRGEARARLRPPQLPKAPARAARRRSAQLGALVRGVAAERPRRRRRARRAPVARREPGRRSEDLARDGRLASRGWRHRARRAAQVG